MATTLRVNLRAESSAIIRLALNSIVGCIPGEVAKVFNSGANAYLKPVAPNLLPPANRIVNDKGRCRQQSLSTIQLFASEVHTTDVGRL